MKSGWWVVDNFDFRPVRNLCNITDPHNFGAIYPPPTHTHIIEKYMMSKVSIWCFGAFYAFVKIPLKMTTVTRKIHLQSRSRAQNKHTIKLYMNQLYNLDYIICKGVKTAKNCQILRFGTILGVQNDLKGGGAHLAKNGYWV